VGARSSQWNGRRSAAERSSGESSQRQITRACAIRLRNRTSHAGPGLRSTSGSYRPALFQPCASDPSIVTCPALSESTYSTPDDARSASAVDMICVASPLLRSPRSIAKSSASGTETTWSGDPNCQRDS
jgi:hypothetical protein